MSTISLVTGANRGIGREVCRQLAELGHTVILTARDPGAAAEAAQAVRAEPIRLDVTDRASVADAAHWTKQRYGKLDILVNNAAITYDTWQRAVTADLAVVREAAETNLYGPWLMVQEFLPLLRNSDHPRIVNVSSEAASLASMGGGTPAYTASKVALNALTRMLADELRRDRILVNAVCPGWVATDMGGPGGRPVADGAAGVVWAATLPDSGPTGGFFPRRPPAALVRNGHLTALVSVSAGRCRAGGPRGGAGWLSGGSRGRADGPSRRGRIAEAGSPRPDRRAGWAAGTGRLRGTSRPANPVSPSLSIGISPSGAPATDGCDNLTERAVRVPQP
jgi:NAD(P)-dependent dehydrogenase (short-subunit alcohol dehydrogenase family)